MARRTAPAPLVYLGVAVAVAALLAGVWGLGGFERRTDFLQTTKPGTLIETGPYEFSFATATAQPRTAFDSKQGTEWVVTVLGTGRTTGDESIAPVIGLSNGMFASKDPVSGEVQEPSAQRFGGSQSYVGGISFTPGLPAVPYQVEFTFSKNFRPGDTVRFAVFKLEYRDTSLIGTGEKLWHNTIHGYQFFLPLTVLPAKS